MRLAGRELKRPSKRDVWDGFREYVRTCLTIDTRTLAVFRIVAGLLIILDLLLRARRFTFFYTEDGVVPRALGQDTSPDNAFSVYFFTGDPTLTAVLFVIQGLIAVQLIIGYKTRIAMILSFLLVISLDHRNMLVTSYADILFRFLLFWAMFLPLGERWSIDAIHAEREPRPRVANVASLAILAQMVYMYFANWLHKAGNELWTSGDATPLIFGLDDTTFLLGDTMRNFMTALEWGGMFWYYLLFLSPLLLLMVGRPRMLLALCLFGGHLGFAFTVRIGAFPYVGMMGVSLFFQSVFWDDARRVLTFVRVYPYVERAAGAIERGGYWLAGRLPRLALGEQIPRPVAAGVFSGTFALAFFMVMLLPAISFFSNELTDWDIDLGDVEEQNRELTAILGVRQPDWTIFAPQPRTTDRYHVIAARTTDDELLDLYNNRPLSFERPYSQLHRQYDTYRERFYMTGVRRAGSTGGATWYLSEHLCETWRGEDDTRLTHINIYVFSERVTRETIDRYEDREVSSDLVYEHGCEGNEPMTLTPPDEATH